MQSGTSSFVHSVEVVRIGRVFEPNLVAGAGRTRVDTGCPDVPRLTSVHRVVRLSPSPTEENRTRPPRYCRRRDRHRRSPGSRSGCRTSPTPFRSRAMPPNPNGIRTTPTGLMPFSCSFRRFRQQRPPVGGFRRVPRWLGGKLPTGRRKRNYPTTRLTRRAVVETAKQSIGARCRPPPGFKPVGTPHGQADRREHGIDAAHIARYVASTATRRAVLDLCRTW